MDIFTEALRLVLLVLLNCELRGCYKVACTGQLIIDQDRIPMGSNLTVHCQSSTVSCGRVFIMKFNQKEFLRKTSCSSVTAQVLVNEPKFSLYCLLEIQGKHHIICGRDIIANPIPSRPQIRKMVFAKGSLSPTVHWHSSDSMEDLKPELRFQMGNSNWEKGNVTQTHRGMLVLLEKLKPLTSYKFELRVCTASVTYNCSLWSKTFRQSSPGKAPSTKLDVWRIITRNEQTDTQNVTVMWKPLGTEDYKGVLHHYEIVYRQKGATHVLNCSTTDSQYTLQLPLAVTELNVSAVTSAGSSPPALVRLTCSGIQSPDINSNHATGGGINLMWASHDFSNRTSKEMLGFVVQWQCAPLQVQWKRNDKHYNSLYIQATPPSLCNISFFVETSDGVSCPSFKQIHMIKKDTGTTLEDIIGPHVGLQISPVQSPAGKMKNGLVVGICLIIAVPLIIIVNLMYLKCTRQRIRKVCVSMGPSWLFQNLPKLGNSNAIKLLKDERCGSDLCWQPVDNDPPLSPVEDYSPPVERKVSYPIVHKELITEERTVAPDWTVCSYKPQIMISQGAEAACEVAEREEDEPPWVDFCSPVFDTFGQHFFLNQGMHASLPNCLTVDGRPVSMDLVNGFPFFTSTALDGNMWTEGRFAETGNGDRN
ncbi:interleukin-23 receptor isoform X2 [Clarias gariepinus]|uniref:interleukin-23 receptor isoform X2 n=1 Tax=Clarias gariepinus TaxID=13013 RepID=UPI00234D9321|nr:interleukin-23 receptor isoform X2 [Clarias gariepinus]